jgi:hypothetical protein
LTGWKSPGRRFAKIALNWPDVAARGMAMKARTDVRRRENVAILLFTACNFAFHRQIFIN